VAAALVAVGSAVAAVLAERGRAQLAVGAPAGPAPWVGRVDRAADAIRLGVRPAAPEAGDRVPPYVERDAAAALREALQCGGFVLVVGDSAAGKTRLAHEAVRAALPRHTFVVPDGPAGVLAAVVARSAPLAQRALAGRPGAVPGAERPDAAAARRVAGARSVRRRGSHHARPRTRAVQRPR
jgi:hypothetical protein